jgi:hypothetical protein
VFGIKPVCGNSKSPPGLLLNVSRQWGYGMTTYTSNGQVFDFRINPFGCLQTTPVAELVEGLTTNGLPEKLTVQGIADFARNCFLYINGHKVSNEHK